MIKAIETHWKGYRFRSRLEARWAVFFERLGWRWEYEPEGFDLGDAGYYLPDFRVMTPQDKVTWYEVKPRHITQDDKFTAFELICEDRTGLLCGDPVDSVRLQQTPACPRCGFLHRPDYGFDLTGEEIWWGCQPCDFETPSGGDHEEERGLFGAPVRPHKGNILSEFENYAFIQGCLREAAHKARSARFEYGEAPA